MSEKGDGISADPERPADDEEEAGVYEKLLVVGDTLLLSADRSANEGIKTDQPANTALAVAPSKRRALLVALLAANGVSATTAAAACAKVLGEAESAPATPTPREASAEGGGSPESVAEGPGLKPQLMVSRRIVLWDEETAKRRQSLALGLLTKTGVEVKALPAEPTAAIVVIASLAEAQEWSDSDQT